MKRLLILHNAYRRAGGEDAVVSQETTVLRNAGWDVQTHVVPTPSGVEAFTAAAAAVLGKGGFFSELISLLDRFKPDLLHAHNLFPLFSPSVFPLARKRGIRTVLTLHNFRPLCLNGLFLTPPNEICERCAVGNFLHGVIRGCYRDSRLQSIGMAAHLALARKGNWYEGVDRFIAPSVFLQKKFLQYGFHSSRIEVQPHFLNEMPVDAVVDAEPWILYLGRLSEEKGVRWLLQTFGLTGFPVKLAIAGTGPLQREVERYQSDNIQFLGFLSGQEKQEWIRKSAAIILPSDCYENAPVVVMEANAQGVPVIVPDLGGMSEQVEPGVNGERYIPRVSHSLKDAVEKIWHAQDRLTMRQKIKSFSEERFSRVTWLENRQRLYASLLS